MNSYRLLGFVQALNLPIDETIPDEAKARARFDEVLTTYHGKGLRIQLQEHRPPGPGTPNGEVDTLLIYPRIMITGPVIIHMRVKESQS